MVSGMMVGNRRGQTLIIAIMVMFVLAIVATVFILLVARNLSRAARMSSTDAVAAIAEAGIRYADEMLTCSEDGADWRPIPDNLPPPPPNMPRDPDFLWLRPYAAVEAPDHSAGPTGGYTRFNYGQGRFLLRVSYNPDPNVAMSKYIKIESIGRWGIVDPNDPTTYGAASERQRREITAYKPIGLTDSCRFITNKDNRPVDVALGVPGFATDYGRPDTSRYGVRGGPIRVNANLVWYGLYGGSPSINIFLRGIQADSPTDDPLSNTHTDLIPIDDVAVAGDIKVDSDPDNDANRVRVRLHELILGSSGSYTDNEFDVVPSTDDDAGPVVFDTKAGFYRDGRNVPDVNRRPRSVKRIEPPLVDQPDPTNTSTRYRVLTLNSGERFYSGRRWVNLGALGWGKGVYIGNSTDKQDESETIFGGTTIRSDIMEEGNLRTTNWKGPYYIPPAVIITLLPDDVDSNGNHCFLITRTDSPGGRRPVWYDPAGNPRPDWGATIRMPYPDPEHGRVLANYMGAGNKRIEGNGVIYAEGNIRVRGMLPKGMKLTIVSNENIYIDGSVLKYRERSWRPSSNDPYRGADSTGGLALLARQNVIVNTTQFFSPLNTIGADDYGTDSLTGGDSSHVVVHNSPDSRARWRFEFGPYESETGTAPSKWYWFVRHAGDYGPAYINAWLNPRETAPNWGILGLNTVFAGLPPFVWGVGDPRFGNLLPPGAGVGSSFACNVFDLSVVGPNLLDSAPGAPNILEIALDQGVYTRANYWMGGMAVLPMDVRIEAIIYAQEGSFFVIPGYWLNPDPSDTDPSNRPPGVDPRFPLYGEPADIRIVIDGAVSENLPASVSDVEKWMAKWGRIPQTLPDGTPTAHPGEGIAFLYDDHVGWPLDDVNHQPVRVDAYGRALPLAPKLPVSGSLVYFGDVM